MNDDLISYPQMQSQQPPVFKFNPSQQPVVVSQQPGAQERRQATTQQADDFKNLTEAEVMSQLIQSCPQANEHPVFLEKFNTAKQTMEKFKTIVSKFSLGMGLLSTVFFVISVTTICAMNGMMHSKKFQKSKLNFEFNPQLIKTSAIISTIVWGLIMIKSYIGYKASQNTDSTSVQSSVKKTFYAAILICIGAIVKVHHEFKVSDFKLLNQAPSNVIKNQTPRGRNLASIGMFDSISQKTSQMSSDMFSSFDEWMHSFTYDPQGHGPIPAEDDIPMQNETQNETSNETFGNQTGNQTFTNETDTKVIPNKTDDYDDWQIIDDMDKFDYDEDEDQITDDDEEEEDNFWDWDNWSDDEDEDEEEEENQWGNEKRHKKHHNNDDQDDEDEDQPEWSNRQQRRHPWHYRFMKWIKNWWGYDDDEDNEEDQQDEDYEDYESNNGKRHHKNNDYDNDEDEEENDSEDQPEWRHHGGKDQKHGKNHRGGRLNWDKIFEQRQQAKNPKALKSAKVLSTKAVSSKSMNAPSPKTLKIGAIVSSALTIVLVCVYQSFMNKFSQALENFNVLKMVSENPKARVLTEEVYKLQQEFQVMLSVPKEGKNLLKNAIQKQQSVSMPPTDFNAHLLQQNMFNSTVDNENVKSGPMNSQQIQLLMEQLKVATPQNDINASFRISNANLMQ